MSGWHREHPELAGTDADPWMADPGYAAAAREAAMYERFPNLDAMIARAEELRDSAICECGHRYDEHDPDPPGGGYCERCGCEGHEDRTSSASTSPLGEAPPSPADPESMNP